MAKEKKILQNLGEFLNATKEARKRGGSTLSPQARRSKAEKALLRAMSKRGWKETKEGYQLSGHVVKVTGKDHILVDGAYTLQLGQGAIKGLDSYMKISATAQ